VPDAVADAVQIGGMPTHEELAMQVFELRQIVQRQDAEIVSLLRLFPLMGALRRQVAQLEAMPHNQWRPDNAGSDPA
jgi:hypothetical protein